MDPLTVAKGGLAAQKLVKFIESLVEKPTRNFERARDELFREWVAELALALRCTAENGEQLENRLDQLEARLDAPEIVRAVKILESEAAVEPQLERRRMLAFIAAGWVNLELQVPQLARVLRVIRELAPEDVYVLFQLKKIAIEGESPDKLGDFQKSPTGKRMYRFIKDSQPSGDLLLASGCLRMRYTTGLNNLGPEVHLTIIGEWVLQALGPYLKAYESDITFSSKPFEELAKHLPKGAHKDRLMNYQELADLAVRLSSSRSE